MRQRQPDRADLPPSRRQAVDDAARDDEMRLGVVVGEDEPFVQVEDPRREPGERARPRPSSRSDVVRGL